MDDLANRRLAADLAEAAQSGAHERVADVVTRLSRADSRRDAAAVVGELTGLCACAVSARSPTASRDVAYGVVVEDELTGPVEVEALPPGPRAALRAVLAALNDDHHSQDIQSGLATSGAPEDVAVVLAHCLIWLTELADAPAACLPRLSCFTT